MTGVTLQVVDVPLQVDVHEMNSRSSFSIALICCGTFGITENMQAPADGSSLSHMPTLSMLTLPWPSIEIFSTTDYGSSL